MTGATILVLSLNVGEEQISFEGSDLESYLNKFSYSPDIVVLGVQEFHRGFDSFFNLSQIVTDTLKRLFSISEHSYLYQLAKMVKYLPRVVYPWSSADRHMKDHLNKISEHTERYLLKKSYGSFSCKTFYFGPTGTIVWYKNEVVRDLSVYAAGTGYWGIFPNKGGLGVEVTLKQHKNSILFLNTHLNAHEGNLERRNWDIKCILQLFGISSRKLNNVFLFGDLNYRLNLSRKEFHEKQSRIADISELFEYDELSIAIKTIPELKSFQEYPPRFPPTFKKKRERMSKDNNDVFANYSIEKRMPGWCDRILYTSSNFDIKCHEYLSFSCNNTSDHDMVIGVFEMNSKEYKGSPHLDTLSLPLYTSCRLLLSFAILFILYYSVVSVAFLISFKIISWIMSRI